jgi:hypothetical protein
MNTGKCVLCNKAPLTNQEHGNFEFKKGEVLCVYMCNNCAVLSYKWIYFPEWLIRHRASQ